MESTCTGASEYGSIIYYSHLIPVFIILMLTFFLLFKSRRSLLVKIFSVFNITFAIWLIGDMVTWISTDYNLISFVWASLDYINVLVYLLALYFFIVFIKDRDISLWHKICLFILSLPAWYVTITNSTITAFDVYNCEALNDSFLTGYKIIIEVIVIICIVIMVMRSYLNFIDKEKKRQIIIVSSALVLFLITFSVTEYISSETGIYEINLYSLFVLPFFLFMIIYSITNLKIFNIRVASTQLLVYVMVILVGSQFFFLENTTNQVLTIVTFIMSLSFGVVLIRDGKRDISQRERIEKLATDLQVANTRLVGLDKQKSEFVSFATHQLRAPLTAMKGYTSLILEGEMGQTTPEIKQAVTRIFDSSNTLTNIVNDYLNISRIELGTMKYNFEILDLKDLVNNVIGELKPNIEKKGLKFTFMADNDPKVRFIVHADRDKLKQVIANLIDNSVKYTPSGSILISLVKDIKNRKITFSIKDTGVGIALEVMPKLFSKFTRAENANKQNIYGTGLGLYIAKDIVTAHKGRLWAESQGEGKGSTFFLELDMEV